MKSRSYLKGTNSEAQSLLYQPVLNWLLTVCGNCNFNRPFFLGLSGAQGAGKTTLSLKLIDLLREKGISSIGLSLDDFYLDHDRQIKLARANPGNPYLQQRGYPGTHDISLGSRTLQALRQPGPWKEPVLVPRYNKSAHRGEGDRRPVDEWVKVTQPPDIVIFEGWMLGFTRQDEKSIHENHLRQINRYLEEYQDWWRLLDAFIYLKSENLDNFVEWRVEAEEKMRDQGLPGMSSYQVKAYAEKFKPAYRLYANRVLGGMEVPYHLVIPIGKDRLPVRKFLNSPN